MIISVHFKIKNLEYALIVSGSWLIVDSRSCQISANMLHISFYLFIYLLLYVHESLYSLHEVHSSAQEPNCPNLLCGTQLYLVFSAETQY